MLFNNFHFVLLLILFLTLVKISIGFKSSSSRFMSSKFIPKSLFNLSISAGFNITESSVYLIVKGCPIDFLFISIGTKITGASMDSVVVSFSYQIILPNAKNKTLYPKSSFVDLAVELILLNTLFKS